MKENITNQERVRRAGQLGEDLKSGFPNGIHNVTELDVLKQQLLADEVDGRQKNFIIRVLNALRRNGVNRVREVRKMSDGDILKARSLGEAALAMLRGLLGSYGED